MSQVAALEQAPVYVVSPKWQIAQQGLLRRPVTESVKKQTDSDLVAPRAADQENAVNPATDEALMARYVLEDDHPAFRTLFDRHASRLMRIFYACGLDGDTAHDLTQQTFFQLHRARADFRQGARFRPWLVTIANNLKRDCLRRKGRWRMTEYDTEMQSAAPTQSAGLDQREEKKRVRDALAKIPEKQREVIELHWFAEMPFDEVAQSLGIGLSAAKVRAHRGYAQLRTLLGSAAEGDDQ